MAIFGKRDETHAGSGLDKSDPKSVKERVVDAFTAPFRTLVETAKADKDGVGPAAPDIPPTN